MRFCVDPTSGIGSETTIEFGWVPWLIEAKLSHLIGVLLVRFKEGALILIEFRALSDNLDALLTVKSPELLIFVSLSCNVAFVMARVVADQLTEEDLGPYMTTEVFKLGNPTAREEKCPNEGTLAPILVLSMEDSVNTAFLNAFMEVSCNNCTTILRNAVRVCTDEALLLSLYKDLLAYDINLSLTS